MLENFGKIFNNFYENNILLNDKIVDIKIKKNWFYSLQKRFFNISYD